MTRSRFIISTLFAVASSTCAGIATHNFAFNLATYFGLMSILFMLGADEEGEE